MERLSSEAFARSIQDSVFDYRREQFHKNDTKRIEKVLKEARQQSFRIIGAIYKPAFLVEVYFARLRHERHEPCVADHCEANAFQGTEPVLMPEGYELDAVITNDLPKHEVYEAHKGWQRLHVKRWTAFDLESYQANVCVTFFVRQLKGE